MDEEITEKFGRNCLLARRLVERGVRFIELYCSSGSGWDAHVDMEENHSKNCKISDKPIAGLLTDLKARGLLNDTLVIWGGEFGRTPFNEKGKGRDHNPWGFTMWFAAAVSNPDRRSDDGRNRLACHRAPCPCSRHSRDDPSSDGPKPHQPDLPTQRSRGASHNRFR